SKSCTCRLNAGWATRSCAAALVKFNASPTARKYRKCRSSIAEFHYAEKAWLRNQRGIGWFNGRRVNCRLMNDRCNDEHKHHKETRRQSGVGHRRFAWH